MIKLFYGDDYDLMSVAIAKEGWNGRSSILPESLLEPKQQLFSRDLFFSLDTVKGLQQRLEGYDSEIHAPVSIICPKPDKRLKDWKWLQKNATCKEFKAPTKPFAIRKRVREITVELDINVPPIVIDRLVESFGSDIYQSRKTLEQLAIAYEVIPADVTFDAPEALVFDLVKHIVHQDAKAALVCLQKLREQHEPDYKIAAILKSQLLNYAAVAMQQSIELSQWIRRKIEAELATVTDQKRIASLAYAAQQYQTDLLSGQKPDLYTWILLQCA